MRYRFEDFVVDTTSYSISRAGRTLPVRPKVFDVLRYLIEHRERIVAKQELLEALWQDQHVDEFAAPWTVRHVRRLLGQRKGERQPILTVHGRGYRFVAELTEVAGSTSAPAPARVPATVPDPFVGRELVMQRLEAHLAQAKEGRGSCCLVVGAAGIGKTRCMDELGARAGAQGFAVWSGRSIEATCGPVFWPWIQVLHALVGARPALAATGRDLIARLAAGCASVEAR